MAMAEDRIAGRKVQGLLQVPAGKESHLARPKVGVGGHGQVTFRKVWTEGGVNGPLIQPIYPQRRSIHLQKVTNI